MKLSDNPSPSLLFAEHVDPANPSANQQRLFVDTDHVLKMIDSSGTVTAFNGGAGMATDPLWDAAGDLAVGTGANTAGKLTKGADSTVLTIDPSTHLPIWQAPGGGSRAGASNIDDGGNHSITSTSFADVSTTELGLTLTTNGGPILCMFSGTIVGPGGSERMMLDITIDGTRIGAAATNNGLFTSGSAATLESATIIAKSGALGAGSHTVRLQARVGGGTGTIQAGTAGNSLCSLIVQEQDA
jgi:hypothetical protein